MHAKALSINEVFYRRTSPSQAERFIELYNNSNSALDISDYKMEGEIYFAIPSGTSIPANSYLIIAENPTSLQSKYNIPSQVSVLGPWFGTLNLYKGDINIHNEEFCKIDGLSYSGWHEWPSSDIGAGQSVQKINPSLSSEAGGSWDNANPTPGAPNNNVIINDPSNIPTLLKVEQSPERPNSNQAVQISSKILNTAQIARSVYFKK